VEERTWVVVYGCSLSMAGIAASLKAEAGLAVVCVDPNSPTARQCLNDVNPAVIVFDRSDPYLDLDITLLRERPGLLLIGVDPSSDELLVLSSRSAQALSVADLLRVIVHRDRNTKPIGEASSEG
jgi:hypothetical protein